ncbi:acetyltransferase, including N-acetylase of ribosomal protein [Solibacillus silvestris StLB046]|uniref:Acetyltransferase, including N-acetylase of ribosomal protein n=1 Tax=Solibacillus silvestris (strain StLB046) TaxID=1002809 RepID=F2F1R7_SOLSS|nr:GNAT family N-acetyltransferase [Solibacillus silvestris]BAK16930.1 acetyltransferase, including N-acetylase of ribosomal protein [Solibacillus silvestris StLB046]
MDINRNEIYLRKLKLEDFNAVVDWSRDDRFCEANGWQKNRDHLELFKWWERCVTNQQKDMIRLGIEYKNRLIGYADLAEFKNNSAEIGIAIGDSTLWNNGIGTQMIKKLLNYANEQFGVTTFYGKTYETNHRSRKMMEKVGFTEESREGTELNIGKEVKLVQYKLELNE